MSSPRKFAEKIALIQQKQAEGDAAFNTIIYEVEAAKQGIDRRNPNKTIIDGSGRKHDKYLQESNGISNSDNYDQQSFQIEQSNNSDHLLLPPDGTLWRRAHSDPSIHPEINPALGTNYPTRLDHENNCQQIQNYDPNDPKYASQMYSTHHGYQTVTHEQTPTQYQYPNSSFHSPQHQYDLNNNNHHFLNGQTNSNYSLSNPVTTNLPQQTATPTHNNHQLLGMRYSSGSTTPNVLMLPPNQHPRGAGSLPDLRSGNTVHHHCLLSNQRYLRSPSSDQPNDEDLFSLGQQQLPSSIGPVKTSPIMRRRHSPIGDMRPTSPRRQNSPTPELPSNQHNNYRVEPSSPQSLSSYSPQSSPHIAPSPTTNEFSPYSPSSTDSSQGQTYCTLPTHFDRINLDANNSYSPHRSSPSPTSLPKHDQSSSTNTSMTNGNQENYFQQNHFYQPYPNDISSSFHPNQTTNAPTFGNQKSPTIPNIILTGVDCTKLDLSKELDGFLDQLDIPFDNNDFLLNSGDLSVDPLICDETFRLDS